MTLRVRVALLVLPLALLMGLCTLARAQLASPSAAGTVSARQRPEIVRLPLVIDGKATKVVAHIYKRAGEGPFPLVIHSHGRSGSQFERYKLEFPVPVGHGNY